MRPFLAIALLVAAALSGCVQPGSSSASGMMSTKPLPAQSQTSYTCPTCGGRYAQSGNCPKCGLDLVPKSEPAPGNYK
jgi:hypothetical protein